MKDYCAVESKSLSTRNDKRYVMVDKATGEIVDDAQGYGYRSKQSAYRGFSYRFRSKEKKEKDRKEKAIRAWMACHDDFVKALLHFELLAEMGRLGPMVKHDAQLVQTMLDSQNLHPDFSAAELLKQVDLEYRSVHPEDFM